MTFVRVVYAVAIGVLLVMLVIVGIEAFYPAPSRPIPSVSPPVILEPPPGFVLEPDTDDPEQPCFVLYPGFDDQASDEWQQALDEWQQEWNERQQEWAKIYEEYQRELALHERSMFLVVLPLGALLAVGGTFVRRRLDTLGAGLILGGMGTMIYAIVPFALDSVLRFTGIAVALAVLIFVGFRVLNSSRQA